MGNGLVVTWCNVMVMNMNDDEKILLLELLMRDIRGNWYDPRDRILLITSLCDEIVSVPKQLLDAIKKNAETFDGEFNDGRIFRDGQLFLPDEVIDSLGLPDAMKGGVSGNMAKLLGATSRTSGYRGTYDEVAKFVTIPRCRSSLSNEFLREFDANITYPEGILE